MAYEHICPHCGHDTITITAETSAIVRFSPDGGHDVRETHDVEWSNTSPARCDECGFHGNLGMFAYVGSSEAGK